MVPNMQIGDEDTPELNGDAWACQHLTVLG